MRSQRGEDGQAAYCPKDNDEEDGVVRDVVQGP